MYSVYGKIVRIDLNTVSFFVENLDPEISAKYLGGKGLASYLLDKFNPPGINPLSPENCLIFSTGPLTGNFIWGSSRYGVFTKSPQTGYYSESYSGGRTPEAIDSVGYDAIVIQGQSRLPVVLSISPHSVEFHDAKNIWGMDTYQTEDTVLQRFADPGKAFKKRGAIVIGPAAEQLVRFAVIENDYWRSAGRTGVGTVMGSKKLKAILFQGNQKRKLWDPISIRTLYKDMAIQSKGNPGARALKSNGTPIMVNKINNAGAFPTRYWKEGTCSHYERINADALHKQCRVKPNACSKCFLSCGRLSTVQEGRHAGLTVEGPEYETIYAFGGLCLVNSIEEIIYLNDICDRLGMDTISAGNLCAFTIEAVHLDRIDYRIDYGKVDAIAELLHKIAYREGIGNVLAEGIKFAAREWNIEDIAVHAKGMEPAGYDPRVLKGMGLSYAISDRGACHLRANFYTPELNGTVDSNRIREMIELYIDMEDISTLYDTMILCRFYRAQYTWERLTKIVQAATGLDIDQSALKNIASSISKIVRNFNIREGLQPEDDGLSKGLYRKINSTDQVITETELKNMVKEYYRQRDWREDGRPSEL